METYKALVIDDEQIVLDSVSKILKEEGFEIYTALSGGSGISHAINESYDIVLTDIRMPRIDGYKVIRDIRKFNPTVPIVIITGFASVGSAVQAMKLGAANYLEKPFTPEQLIDMVRGTLREASESLPEEQTVVHPATILKILKRGAKEPAFAKQVFENNSEVFDGYDLTKMERLAIITGDIGWLEDQMGIIEKKYKEWIEPYA